MDNVDQSTKFRKTAFLDMIIILSTIIISNLAFIIGLELLGLAVLMVTIGYIAKTIAIKSYGAVIVSCGIGIVGIFLLTYFVFKANLFPVIMVLGGIFAGCIFAICVLNKKSKMFCVVVLTTVLVLFFALGIFYLYYMNTQDTLSINGFIDYINQFFVTLQTTLETTLKTFSDTFLQGEDVSEMATTYITFFKFISLGLVIMICEFASVFSTLFFDLSVKQSNAHVIVPNEWTLSPNKILAHIFLIATGIYYLTSILTMFGLDSLQVVYLVSINILMIIIPTLFIVGIKRLLFTKRKNAGIPKVFVILIGIVMFIISVPFFFILVSSFGASFTIIKARREEQLEKDENKEEQFDYNCDNYDNNRYDDKYDDNNYRDEYHDVDYHDDEYYDEFDDYDNYNEEYNREHNPNYSQNDDKDKEDSDNTNSDEN